VRVRVRVIIGGEPVGWVSGGDSIGQSMGR
jgi:hypothetical protein